MQTTAPTPDLLLTVKELSARLHKSPATLQRWRTEGTGPRFITVGLRGICYRESDVAAWLAQHERMSTAVALPIPSAAA